MLKEPFCKYVNKLPVGEDFADQHPKLRWRYHVKCVQGINRHFQHGEGASMCLPQILNMDDVKIASLCWAVVQSRVVVPPTADRWRRGGAGWPGTHLGLHRAGRPPPATPRHQNKTDHSHHQHLASVSADITSHQPHCPCYANHQTFISVAQVISWRGRNDKTCQKSCIKTL